MPLLIFCVTTAAQFPRYQKYQIAQLARQHLFIPLLNRHESDTGFHSFQSTSGFAGLSGSGWVIVLNHCTHTL